LALAALAGQTPLERPLTVLILFLVHLQQLEAEAVLTSLTAVRQVEMALLVVLEAAGRLIRLPAQVLALEERGL
jgi:hypothetical protein